MPDTPLLSSTSEQPITGAPRPGPIHFSLNGAPEDARPDMYREFFGRSVFRLDVERLDNVPFEVDVTLQALPGLHMFSGKVHGSRNRRTREFIADNIDDYGLMVNLGGPYQVTQGERELVLEEGEATLVCLSEVCSFAHLPPGDVLALRFPRARFAPLVTRIDDCVLRRIPRDTRALRLLMDYIGIARDEQVVASRELPSLIVSHIYDLIALAVGATRDAEEIAQGRGMRAARLRAIKQDIAANLEHGDLSVAELAARHGCTPRFIQRLFESEGTTFTDYVVTQRLARVHRMLTDPRNANEKIAAIAYDSGFSDLSYFNRAFRQRYGETPSDVRAATLAVN
jgi:AraC-like DNA-binding protein